jgi:rhamnulokinase
MTDLIAVDLGNESGRVMGLRFDGEHISSAEVYRFPNNPVALGTSLNWDVLRLWHEIQQGLAKAMTAPVDGIAVDSFGVDFGLLDARGQLIANPVHMRDSRTEGMMEWVFDRVPKQTLWERTGIGFYVINTLYQLAAIVKHSPWQLEAARTLLTMPNLLNYWLTGEALSEFTHTTTTQCYNPFTQNWDWQTLTALDIPAGIFPNVIQPGERIGAYQGVPVFTVASHDTGSAVAAETANFAYISSGTWSLLGLETKAPIVNDLALKANITNEGGAFGTFRPLNLVMGLWILQQCRATWNAQGQTVDYASILGQAEGETPLRSLIDPDNPLFFPPGDMPARVRDFCRANGQPVPESVGQVARCVLESLALKYRYVLEQQIAASGQTVEVIHIVGGGAQNPLLCQMTADATGCPVLAGPVEATALGNGLIQLVALSEITDLAQARAIVRQSLPPTRYLPENTDAWETAYHQFKRLVN